MLLDVGQAFVPAFSALYADGTDGVSLFWICQRLSEHSSAASIILRGGLKCT